MRTEVIRDTRLLDALEYIDDAYIASAARYKMKYAPASADEPKITWRTPLKHSKIYVALAASLLLLAMASPLVSFFTYVVSNFTAGAGSGTAEENSGIIDDTEANSDHIFGSYLDPIKDLEPLTNELLNMVNSCRSLGNVNIGELNEGMSSGIKYYGTIEGYVVLWEVGDTDATHSIGLAGYDFYYHSGFDIYLYKDYKRVTMQQVYEDELITDDFIKTIYLRSNEYMRYFTDRNIVDKIPITAEDLSAINTAWKDKFGETSIYAESLTEVQLGKQDTYCYGKFGNNIVFRSRDESVVTEEFFTYYEIAGFTFTICWPSKEIWVYSNDRIIPLNQAYDEGILSYADMEAIYYRHSYSYH